jgi:integrase
MARVARNMGADFPSQGTVYDLAGLEVDATGWVWRQNHPVRQYVLNFHRLRIGSGPMLAAIAAFIADKVATSSPDHVRGHFDALAFLHKSQHFQSCLASGRLIDECLVSELRLHPIFKDWRLHYVRDWYLWSAGRGFPQFSEQVAEVLEDLVIPGNPTGEAVRTRDPLKGAFDEIEFLALTTKLRAIGRDVMTPLEYALCWLAIALGCNPLAYALLREEDFKPLKEVGTDRIYARLDVPRIKKGDALYRAQFHEKLLNDEIGAAVTNLILHNQARRDREPWPEGCAFPLFPRASIDRIRAGGPNREFAMHLRAEEITPALDAAIRKLKIISHRTGEPLKVNARRFRRTYGTRAVEEGASPLELAVMLDHSDLGTVQVYFETRASQVNRLDAAMALKLAPIADAFMGRIVRSEADAVNGGDPSKRIRGSGGTVIASRRGPATSARAVRARAGSSRRSPATPAPASSLGATGRTARCSIGSAPSANASSPTNSIPRWSSCTMPRSWRSPRLFGVARGPTPHERPLPS